MSELEEWPQKEVATHQGITLSGAKSRIQRGRKLLKEMLESCCRFEKDSRGRLMGSEAKAGGCLEC